MLERSQVVSLRDIASQINAASDLLEILSQLVLIACRYGKWTMGSIMSIDAAEGLAHVVARYDPALIQRPLMDRWTLSDSPALIALQRNESVYVRDIRSHDQFIGYRRESLERDYRSIMVIPMGCDDLQGRPMVLSVVSRPILDATDDLLAFMDLLVHLGAIAVDRHKRLEAERRASRNFQSVLEAHNTLLQHVLGDGSITSLVQLVHELFDDGVIVVDLTTNQVLAGRPPQALALDESAWSARIEGALHSQLIKTVRDTLGHADGEEVELHLEEGGRRRPLVARIERLTVDRELVGAFILFPNGDEADGSYRMMLESVRFAVSIQMMRNLIRFRYETRTQSEVFLELVEGRWTKPVEFKERAQRIGIDLRLPHQMVVVDLAEDPGRGGESVMDAHHAIVRLLNKHFENASAYPIARGFVCLIVSNSKKNRASTDEFVRALSDELSYYLRSSPTILASDACIELEDYPVAWARCRRILDIAHAFGRTGVLSSQDFGPLPMLVAAAGTDDVRNFVQVSLGAIMEHDGRYRTSYLETLVTYLRESCRSQACADAMGIHVTTLRYRIMRLNELFGVDVGTPEKRFSVELALQLHKVISSGIEKAQFNPRPRPAQPERLAAGRP